MTTVMSTAGASGLYREVRGSGPAVLLVPGATGDAGHFTRTADRLADRFTVLTFDRRGNSRSPATDPDKAATMAAQADDAAAVIRAAGVEQAVVVGTSGGAIVTLELLARHPEVVRGAVVHEPPLLSLLPAPSADDPLQDVFALAATDPSAALEAFVRLNASPSAWDGLEPATRDRMRGNATTLFAHEVGEFISYRPDGAALRACGVPVQLVRSQDGLPIGVPVMGWLAEQLGVTCVTVSGHHAPYLDTAEVFAEELRPMLERLWA